VQEAEKDTSKDAKQPAALDADGFYRVLEITYTGDTHSTDWYCDMVCVALDSTSGKTTDKKR
jgi:hypothetical protein